MNLTSVQRKSLINSFKSGALKLSSGESSLRLRGAGSQAAQVYVELQKLAKLGATKQLVIHLLKSASQISEDYELDPQTHYFQHETHGQVQARLVMSPPDLSDPLLSYQEAALSVINRAQSSLWISTYSITSKLFGRLINSIKNKPQLSVHLLMHIIRQAGDTRPYSELIAEMHDLITQVWPQGVSAPKIYHDPSEHTQAKGAYGAYVKTSRQHSKCIIADDEVALIGSANLSEAAYNRNVEVGCIVESPKQISALTLALQHLISTKKLQLLPPKLTQKEDHSPAWLDEISAAEIGGLPYGLLNKLKALGCLGKLSDPLILDELKVNEVTCQPTLGWEEERIAILSLPPRLFTDHQAHLDQLKTTEEHLKKAGWLALTIHKLEEIPQLALQLQDHLSPS